MDRKMAQIGSLIVAVTVAMFAVFMIIQFEFGSYLVCTFLPIGFIMMTAGFYKECPNDRKATGLAGVVFAAIYATLIVIVYFAQNTTVLNETLTNQASTILDFKKSSLLFNYDLLGYGFMSLSTFFTGLTMTGTKKSDKINKWMMIIHGVFFIGCLIMPMTGMFISGGEKSSSSGVIALEFWCLYFIPIAVMSYLHFRKNGEITN